MSRKVPTTFSTTIKALITNKKAGGNGDGLDFKNEFFMFCVDSI